MPKPGYYYYQNKCALKGISLIGIFALGTYLAKFDSHSDGNFLELYRAFRVPVLLGSFVLVIILYIIRLFERKFGEPKCSWFECREDFIAALTKYCKRKGYLPGWVYYRSRELWPEK